MKYQVAIIDDDRMVCDLVKAVLKANFENINVTVFNKPVIVSDVDIYFIDNQFSDGCFIIDLLNDVREVNPHALVIAMSGTLEIDVVEKLMKNGCDAIWNKNWNKGREDVLNIIKEYMLADEMNKLRSTIEIKNIFHNMSDKLYKILKK
jgi:DNA-binding NtrC family response regulator